MSESKIAVQVLWQPAATKGENIVVVQNILECEQQAEALGREFISYLEEDGVKTCFSSAACNAAVPSMLPASFSSLSHRS